MLEEPSHLEQEAMSSLLPTCDTKGPYSTKGEEAVAFFPNVGSRTVYQIPRTRLIELLLIPNLGAVTTAITI